MILVEEETGDPSNDDSVFDPFNALNPLQDFFFSIPNESNFQGQRELEVAIRLTPFIGFDNATGFVTTELNNLTSLEIAEKLNSIKVIASASTTDDSAVPITFQEVGDELVWVSNSSTMANVTDVTITSIQNASYPPDEFFVSALIVENDLDLISFLRMDVAVAVNNFANQPVADAQEELSRKELKTIVDNLVEIVTPALISLRQLLKIVEILVKREDNDGAMSSLEAVRLLVDTTIIKSLKDMENAIKNGPARGTNRFKRTLEKLQKKTAALEAMQTILKARVFLLTEFKFPMPDVSVVEKKGRAEYRVGTKRIYLDGSILCDEGALLHEYGHAVHRQKPHTRFFPGGAHSLIGLSSDRMAFSEGWATFFAAIVTKKSVWTVRNKSGREVGKVDLEKDALKRDNEMATKKRMTELSVMSVFLDLVDGGNGLEDTDNDGLSLTLAELFMCFCMAANNFKDFLKTLCCKFDDDKKEKLIEILKMNKMEKFELPAECKVE